jgi:hypothetical protein
MLFKNDLSTIYIIGIVPPTRNMANVADSADGQAQTVIILTIAAIMPDRAIPFISPVGYPGGR